jgi:hypothetical protein
MAEITAENMLYVDIRNVANQLALKSAKISAFRLIYTHCVDIRRRNTTSEKGPEASIGGNTERGSP